MRIHIKAATMLLIASSMFLLGQGQKTTVDPAPVPSIMVKAQKSFIVNGGGDDKLYDLFYAEMKSWGKYQLVGSADEADLTFELSFGSQGEPTRVYTNPANGRTYS